MTRVLAHDRRSESAGETPAQLRQRADQIESRTCTGFAAAWCPVHGDCTCYIGEDGEAFHDNGAGLNSADCPLHSRESSHAAAELKALLG